MSLAVQIIQTLMFSTKAIVQLIRNFNVNPTFLFNGTGKMFLIETQTDVFVNTLH
jgi:hypothetical protein